LSASEPTRYHFANYVFSVETMSLTRDGYSVRLSEQSARVLAEFMRHPGELVTRQQLSRVLWAEGVFTESEQGINNIISKLRITLRDDSRNPKYIDTVPKRGYQFLAPITPVSPDDASGRGEPSNADGPRAELLAASKVSVVGAADGNLAERPTPANQTWIHRNRSLVVQSSLLLFAVLALGTVGGLMWRHRHPPERLPPPTASLSLAVAPFDLANAGPDQTQLAESFRLDLIDSLSQMPGINVLAAHSVTAKNTDTAGHTSPQKLDVTAILYTEFSRSGDIYTLRMELVRNSDSAHLQTWQYKGTVAQLEAIREQAQADIFGYCTGSATAQGQTAGSTQNPAAYELYLRARYHVRQVDNASLDKARAEYEEAIRLDPDFAKAYAGLAQVQFTRAVTDADYKRSELLAQKAITLAPNVAEAHAVLGYAYFRHEWRFSEGEQEERKAISLEPHESHYHVWLSLMLAKLGQFDESEKEIEVAKKDDPYWVEVYVGEVFLTLSEHKLDRMMRSVNTIIALKPDWPDSYHERAWANWALGRYPQAIADWRRVAQMQGAAERVAFEDRGLVAYRAGGEKAYARLRMEAALQYASRGQTDGDFVPAEWAAYAGYDEISLRELARGVEQRDRESTNLAINPAYNSLRSDPRFQTLLRRIGLPSLNTTSL
jgi:DNA-binding winged helix-turn-helix (wHTH) protein/tetratricopeptide (TPR) repeat protein